MKRVFNEALYPVKRSEPYFAVVDLKNGSTVGLMPISVLRGALDSPYYVAYHNKEAFGFGKEIPTKWVPKE